MCKFCDGIADWSRTHCYRCDVPLTATGAEYQLCPGCLSVLGLGEQPTEPEVYWRARESAAQPTDEEPELREGGGHGMTTEPLDGLEQLRRIIDEQPEPAPESVMLGLDYCYAEWVAERARHAEEVANRVAEMRAWGEAKFAGAQHEIAHLRDQLRRVGGERDEAQRQCGELHEHLALMVRYLEEEASEGDGIAEQHWDGYQGAKSVLMRTAPNRAAWETRMVEFAELQKVASHVPGLSAALDEARHELASLRSLLPDVRACAEFCVSPTRGSGQVPPPGARRILAALDSRKDESGDGGTPWHQVGDGAFASPFGTIRKCIDCDCLVAGGPTRCRRCVAALDSQGGEGE